MARYWARILVHSCSIYSFRHWSRRYMWDSNWSSLHNTDTHVYKTIHTHIHHSSFLKMELTKYHCYKKYESMTVGCSIQFVNTVPIIMSFLLLVNTVVFRNVGVNWYCVFIQLIPHQWCQWFVPEMVQPCCYCCYLTEESVIVSPKECHQMVA